MSSALSVLTLVVTLVMLVATAVYAQDDRADWVDPNDMLNFDPMTGEMRKHPVKEVENEPAGDMPIDDDLKLVSGGQPMNKPDAAETSDNRSTCDCSNHTTQLKACRQRVKELESLQKQARPCKPPDEESEVQFFRQYVLSLVKQFDQVGLPTLTYADSYEADIQISPSDIEILRKFGDGARRSSVQDAHTVLVTMVTRIRLQDVLQVNNRSSFWSLYSLAADNLPFIIQVCCLLVLLQMMFLLQRRLHLSWKMLLLLLLLFSFGLSVVWTWWHMYKVALANRHAVLDKDKPAECHEGASVSLWQTFISAFTITTDPCATYYEKLLVDPMWEISPTQAIAKTITKFFVEPLEHIAHAVNKFLKAILIGLPVTIAPVVLGFIMVVCLFLLMMCCGYRVRIWPFVSFEPTPRPVMSVTSEQQHHHQQRIEDLTEQVQQLTIQQSDAKEKPITTSQQSQGHVLTDPVRPIQGPPVNITIVTTRKSRPSQPRSRRTQIRNLQADDTDGRSLDVNPVDQSEDTLAGGDAMSNLTVEGGYASLDNDSDFEVIHDESSTDTENLETLSSLDHQDSDSEYDSSRDITDHPDDTH